MQFEGSVRLQASRDEVWQFVTDPQRVAQCIPGLQRFEPLPGGKEFKIQVEAEVGPIKPIFELCMVYSLVEAPVEARMRIRGKGGPGSHIGASSYMLLRDVGDGATEMQWSFVVAMTGQLASLDNHFVETVFQRLSRQFFTRVDERLGAGHGVPLAIAV